MAKFQKLTENKRQTNMYINLVIIQQPFLLFFVFLKTSEAIQHAYSSGKKFTFQSGILISHLIG